MMGEGEDPFCLVNFPKDKSSQGKTFFFGVLEYVCRGRDHVKEKEDFPTTDSVLFFPLTNQPSTNANQRDGNVMRILLPLPEIAQLEEHRHSYRQYEAETQLVAVSLQVVSEQHLPRLGSNNYE